MNMCHLLKKTGAKSVTYRQTDNKEVIPVCQSTYADDIKTIFSSCDKEMHSIAG